jgi:uncharacterized protein (DUF1330 family)
MAINVSYSKLKTLGEEVKNYVDTIDELQQACSQAGAKAVTAGGETTRVAGAIRQAVVDVDTEQFAAVKQIIEGFGDALTKVSGLYQKYDDDVYAGFQKIANARQEALAKQRQSANQAQ